MYGKVIHHRGIFHFLLNLVIGGNLANRFFIVWCSSVFFLLTFFLMYPPKQLTTKFDIFTVYFTLFPVLIDFQMYSPQLEFSSILVSLLYFTFAHFFLLFYSRCFIWCFLVNDGFLAAMHPFRLLLHRIFLTLWVNTSVVMLFFIKLFYELLILGQILITSQAFFLLLWLISKVYLIFFFLSKMCLTWVFFFWVT